MSTIARSNNLAELGEWFDRLDRLIKREGLLGHLNLNTEIEYVFRDLLNCAYGWDLDNANDLFGKNQEAFDLSSGSRQIAVQVTTTQNATKIKETLKKFIPTYQKEYQRLVFVYPVMEMKGKGGTVSQLLNGFDFTASRDRIDLSTIYKHAQTLTVDQQNKLLYLVRKELAPLGEAIQLGSEPSVDVLIQVISHMASSGAPEDVLHYEAKPDDNKKLARFEEHASFLKRQYTLHREFYIPVEEARAAVGYDAAKVPRIRLWLMSNSLDLLDKHANNAQTAFEKLTTRLLKGAHQSGHSVDRTAVSYLLADELFRCNVFPNPPED